MSDTIVPPQAPARVLVVDDEQDVLLSFEAILEEDLPHVAVTTSPSPQAALRWFREQPFDLVLSDYVMPEMDGIEFLAKIRSMAPEVPTVLLTAYRTDQLAGDARRIAGITHVVGKPVDPDEFVRLVERLTLEERRHSS